MGKHNKFNRKADKKRKQKQKDQKRFSKMKWGSPSDYSFIYLSEGKDRK